MGDLLAGFAKLQGDGFEYYMQTYSITLGRNSKKATVDVDLASLGGGMNISRHHARIFYEFERGRFVLEVLGKNGCYVEGALHLPGSPPIKLDSQDLLQIGDTKFYFLLPIKNIARAVVVPPTNARKRPAKATTTAVAPGGLIPPPSAPAKKMRGQAKNGTVGGMSERTSKTSAALVNRQHDGEMGAPGGSKANGLRLSAHPGFMVDQESENVEEREILTAVTVILQEQYNPGEWMPMRKLYSELMEHFQGRKLSARFRRLLGVENSEFEDDENEGSRPWGTLVSLLKRHPHHFVINTKLKGRIVTEYVALVMHSD